MISIITTSMGREIYLVRLLESIENLRGTEEIEHYIGFINNSFETLSVGMKAVLYRYKKEILKDNLYILKYQDLSPQQRYFNDIIPRTKGDIIVKLDDDAIIRSDNYFTHVRAIHELIPDSVFSPFPVGLIGNFGGVQSTERHVQYSNKTDVYYTFRKVPHVGGFGRIVPASIARNFVWQDMGEGEDTQFSKMTNNIKKYYLENALIIEHAESTLGQAERFGNKYRGIILR